MVLIQHAASALIGIRNEGPGSHPKPAEDGSQDGRVADNGKFRMKSLVRRRTSRMIATANRPLVLLQSLFQPQNVFRTRIAGGLLRSKPLELHSDVTNLDVFCCGDARHSDIAGVAHDER